MSTDMPTIAAPSLVVDAATQFEVEQFLYFEARLLDDRQFDAWYGLLADDVRYWMPIRRNVVSRDAALEFTADTELATFDDDKESMRKRVVRLGTGMAWAEDPPSRTRHLVSNVIVRAVDGDELDVESAFILYRNHGETDTAIWAGRREDVLRRLAPATFSIARRRITLDQATILADHLSIFF